MIKSVIDIDKFLEIDTHCHICGDEFNLYPSRQNIFKFVGNYNKFIQISMYDGHLYCRECIIGIDPLPLKPIVEYTRAIQFISKIHHEPPPLCSDHYTISNAYVVCSDQCTPTCEKIVELHGHRAYALCDKLVNTNFSCKECTMSHFIREKIERLKYDINEDFSKLTVKVLKARAIHVYYINNASSLRRIDLVHELNEKRNLVKAGLGCKFTID